MGDKLDSVSASSDVDNPSNILGSLITDGAWGGVVDKALCY